MQTFDKDAMLEGLAKAWRISGGCIPFVIGRSGVGISVPADTTEDILVTLPIEADVLGLLGWIDIETWWSITTSANTKTPRVRFGGPAGVDCLGAVFTASTGLKANGVIANKAAKNSQSILGSVTSPTVGVLTVNTTAAVDTSLATSIVISGQKQTAGETMTLLAYKATLYPAN
jgi:hypothetical protein